MPYPTISPGTTITAGLLTSMLPLAVQKPSDEPRASTTTMTNDGDLLLPVEANAVYELTAYIVYSQNLAASSTTGITIGWSAPSGATLTWTSGGTSGPTQTTTQDVTAQPISLTRQLPSNLGTNMAAMPFGTLTVSSTAGNFALQWAQVASNGTATIVKAGSWLHLRRTS
jgi:hypothetical protein